ncbi:aldehyde dehydrogenase family protein [Deinococcus sp. UYEF24]
MTGQTQGETTFPVLIGGEWRPAQATGTLHATNPATGEALEGLYPVSGQEDVLAVIAAASGVTPGTPEQLGAFFRRYAELIEGAGAELSALAATETGLPEKGRLLETELPRTTRQLRLAADAALSRSWTRPTIDTEAGLRSVLQPLGKPVVVFGPNNFPFAFNAVSGGDFAAALAAGNPVIAKSHPGHLGTTRALARLAFQAMQESGLHPASLQLLYHLPPELGFLLVGDARVGAVAFTGSRGGGLALKRAADAAGVPIYLELSSVNPVLLLPGAVAERPAELARELFAANTMGAGQFCTNPGLVIAVQGAGQDAFVQALTEAYGTSGSGVLLTEGAAPHIGAGLKTLTGAGATLITGGQAGAPGFRFQPTLLTADAATFLTSPDALQTEVFGPVCLLVTVKEGELEPVLARLEASLTASIYSGAGGSDDALYGWAEPFLRQLCGRLINDRMPTGVAVSSAQMHGGPYPAGGHPGFTSVGIPAALTRFAALRAYDHVRDGRLPAELQDANPTGCWRLVDGRWTQEALA